MQHLTLTGDRSYGSLLMHRIRTRWVYYCRQSVRENRKRLCKHGLNDPQSNPLLQLVAKNCLQDEYQVTGA